jgi:hypothetical protein
LHWENPEIESEKSAEKMKIPCRIKLEEVMDYKKAMKVKQEQLLIDMMKSDEELGLYDS